MHRFTFFTPFSLVALGLSLTVPLAASAGTPQAHAARDAHVVEDTQPTTYVILDFPWPEENAPREEVVIVEMPWDPDKSQATTYTILDFTWPEDEVLPDPGTVLVVDLEGDDGEVFLDDVFVGFAQTVATDDEDDEDDEPVRCSQVFADDDDIGPIQCIHAFSEVAKAGAVQCVSVFADAPDGVPGLTCLDIFLDY